LCDDGLDCTDDTCDPSTGGCVHQTNAVCDDGQACTMDTCGAGGVCGHEPLTGACDDADACTENDACTAEGVCGGSPITCADTNPCTAVSCDAILGCQVFPVDGPCGDASDLCHEPGVCVNGVCTGAAIVCDDQNPCTQESCTAFGCEFAPLPGAPCDDLDACTDNEACTMEGVCGASPITCADASPCTSDGCDPSLGCAFLPTAGPCDDGNACTDGDTCAEGACTGAPKPCDDLNVCTADSCDALLGCQAVPVEGPCGDASDFCHEPGVCADGVCTGKAIVCDDGLGCTDDGCAPAIGCTFTVNGQCNDQNPCTEAACTALGCEYTALPGAPCDDLNTCTENDTCLADASCAGGAKPCDDQNPCTADGCDPTTGCAFKPTTDPCNDGNACTLGDTCLGGDCVGSPEDCDDQDACTADGCDPTAGCTHADISAACEDGEVCTKNQCAPDLGCTYPPIEGAPCDDANLCTDIDTCHGGSCSGAPKDCDDLQACTLDICDVASGACLHHPTTGGTCDDGNACLTDDQCFDGECAGTTLVSCADGNPCTLDTCDAAIGCAPVALEGAPCDDGISCTSPDACVGTVCQGGPSTCDDQNPCTADSCTVTGCANLPDVTASCADTNKCNLEACQADGSCQVTAVVCDDGNACTADGCDPGLGCYVNVIPGGSCSDGDPCTNDACVGTACVGVPKCDDGKLCTTDACSDGSCFVYNNTLACDDGSACTSADVCAGGSCQGIPMDCNDGNECTTDGCNPDGTCSHLAITNGTGCSYNGTCVNGGGICLAGTCIAKETKYRCCETDADCPKGPCTVSSCVSKLCTWDSPGCEDGNPCSVDGCGGLGCTREPGYPGTVLLNQPFDVLPSGWLLHSGSAAASWAASAGHLELAASTSVHVDAHVLLPKLAVFDGAVLRFRVDLEVADQTCGDDALWLWVNGANVKTVACADTNGWVEVSYDLGSLAGQEAEVFLRYYGTAGVGYRIALDDFSIAVEGAQICTGGSSGGVQPIAKEGQNRTPDVVALDDGSFVALWGAGSAVKAQRWLWNIQPAGPEFDIDAAAYPSTVPRAAKKGTAWVVAYRDAAGHVKARLYDGGTAQGASKTIFAENLPGSSGLEVVATTSGWAAIAAVGNAPAKAKVVWLDAGLSVAAGPTSAFPSQPTSLEPGLVHVGSDALYAIAAITPSTNKNLAYSSLLPGAPAAELGLANAFTLGAQANPHARVTKTGEIIAVWASFSQDGSSTDTLSLRRTNASLVGTREMRVADYTGLAQGHPSVGVLATGPMAFWESERADGTRGLAARIMDYDPPAPVFNPSGDTINAETRPRIDSWSEDGRFVAIWEQAELNGTKSIEARVFGTACLPSAVRCDGTTSAETCAPNGSALVSIMGCAADQTCRGSGQCLLNGPHEILSTALDNAMPQATALEAGGFALCYVRDKHIRWQKLGPTGAKEGGEKKVSGRDFSTECSIASWPDSSQVVVWHEENTKDGLDELFVLARTVSPSGGLGSSETLDSVDSNLDFYGLFRTWTYDYGLASATWNYNDISNNSADQWEQNLSFLDGSGALTSSQTIQATSGENLPNRWLAGTAFYDGYALFATESATDGKVYFANISPGPLTGPATPISTVAGSEVRAARLPDGRAVIVWTQGGLLGSTIIDATGYKGAAYTRAPGCPVGWPAVVGLPDGTALAVWEQQCITTTTLMAGRIDAAGAVTGTTTTVAAEAGAVKPSLAAAPDGTVLLVYQVSSDSYAIQTRLLTPGIEF
jgi:hypothetical protein